jgi:outer membrane protein assembly factor BamB
MRARRTSASVHWRLRTWVGQRATIECRARRGTQRIVLAALGGLAAMSACTRDPTEPLSGVLRIAWRASSPGDGVGRLARPATIGDVVVAGGVEGSVVAYELSSGRERWRRPGLLGQPATGGNILIRQGLALIPLARGIAAVEVATGTLRWSATSPVDSLLGRQPGVAELAEIDATESTVFHPAWGASVQAIDVASGQVRWTWRPGRAPTDTESTPFRSGAQGTRVSGDTVYVTGWHYENRTGIRTELWLVALQASTGQELARFRVPPFTGGVPIFSAPRIAGRLVLFTAVGGPVWAIDRFTMQQVWSFRPPVEFATFNPMETRDDLVFVGGGNSNCYALRISDGSVVWQRSVETNVERPMLVTSRFILVPSQRIMFALDLSTGEVRGRGRIPDEDYFSSGLGATPNGGVILRGSGAVHYIVP